jgi:hypothetical protein
MISIDFETHMISPGKLAPQIVCYSEFDGRAPGQVLQRLAGVSRLTKLLERGETLVLVVREARGEHRRKRATDAVASDIHRRFVLVMDPVERGAGAVFST